MEIQPVILAAGEGSKMYPLTENQAKGLLPIANVPMICYTVNYLEKYGFTDYLVITRASYTKEVRQTLESFSQATSKFEMISIPDDDDIGTAEALASTKDKIENNILVISCDMITDAPLHCLVDIHRMYDASLTAMFAEHVEVRVEKDVKSTSKSKQRDPHDACRDFVSIEPKEKRLLFCMNESDLEQDNISIRKSLLKRYPKLSLQTDLVDCHMFLMKKWLLDYLADNERFESLKSDFVPHVVRKQFSKQKKRVQQDDSMYIDDFENQKSIRDKKDIFTYVEREESIKYGNEWSGYKHTCLKDSIQCHAFHTDAFCLRVNTLPSYTYINRQIEKLHSTIACDFKQQPVHNTAVQHGDSQIGKDSLIGEGTILGRKKEANEQNIEQQKSSKKFNKSVIIKRSVIGKHCTIGANVRISNSIIMDHVTIEDGCVIQGSIICSNVTINSQSSLTNCQVSHGQVVKEKTTLENESIVQEEMEFEEDDDLNGEESDN